MIQQGPRIYLYGGAYYIPSSTPLKNLCFKDRNLVLKQIELQKKDPDAKLIYHSGAAPAEPQGEFKTRLDKTLSWFASFFQRIFSLFSSYGR